MPHLAVNQFGQIYMTSPDRDDGMGYGGSPQTVQQGDLTLGAAYLKSQAARTRELLQYKRNQAHRDRQALMGAARQEQKRRVLAAEEARKNRIHDDPMLRKAVTTMAAKQYQMKGAMGCGCDYKTQLGGNVASANGMSGFAGKTRDEQTIHAVISGFGAKQARPVDPVEARQHQMKVDAERIMRLKARR